MLYMSELKSLSLHLIIKLHQLELCLFPTTQENYKYSIGGEGVEETCRVYLGMVDGLYPAASPQG